jgi:hypothetical protein
MTVMDGYARRSKKKDATALAEQQEREIRAVAERLGVTLGLLVFEDDVSGAKPARERRLEELVQRCERRESANAEKVMAAAKPTTPAPAPSRPLRLPGRRSLRRFAVRMRSAESPVCARSPHQL